MSETLGSEGKSAIPEGSLTEDLLGGQPEVQFRVVKLEAEDPEVVRQRNGLHAGRLATGGTKRKGKHGRKG